MNIASRISAALAAFGTLACGFLEDGSGGGDDDETGPRVFEVCDGEDNDGDSDVDEGFGVGTPCESPGECGAGTLECAGPFGTRCSSSPGGSASAAAHEICDLNDNDCDGDTDEGFAVGTACVLEGACPGVRSCAGGVAICVLNEDALSEEVCDGKDNDCDGRTDYIVDGVEARSVCECQQSRLSFGAQPTDGSHPVNAKFCDGIRPQCEDDGGSLELSFCLDCSSGGSYAMCASGRRMDIGSFVKGGDPMLTVRFTFDSPTDSQALVNLYYQIDHPSGTDGSTSVRRYFRLLNFGDAPGAYTKTFFSEEVCHSDSEIDCRGAETDCPSCRGDDTCGDQVGAACGDLSFESVELQLAVEDGCSAETFEGTLRVHDVYFGPPQCER